MLNKKEFGTTKNGSKTYLFSISNDNGVKVEITNFGGRIKSIFTPDKNNVTDDIVLGYDNIIDYENSTECFGAIIGRNSNRIKNAQFSLNGHTYHLEKNDGNNNLHSGFISLDKRVWNYETSDNSLTLTYLSEDNDGGFPGNVKIKVVYTLNNSNQLKIDYSATTDKDTLVNMTNHSYFNLSGHKGGAILNHLLKINADSISEINKDLTQTGKIYNIRNTPFDFNDFTEVGKRINDSNIQLEYAGGYDHNFILRSEGLRDVAELIEPTNGRTLKVTTDMPCMQLYTGNFLNGAKGKDGAIYNKRSGLCFETQFYPDSLNVPEFPSAILKKGEEYKSTTIFSFGIK